eukprot:Gb_20317 [translate_table: standard]
MNKMERRRYTKSSSGDNEIPVVCASWIAGFNSTDDDGIGHVVLGKAGGHGTDDRVGVLERAAYHFKQDFLSEGTLLLEEVVPVSMVVHPGGDGIMCSLSKNCKFFELDSGKSKLKASDNNLYPLQGIGPQKCLAFSADGSKFATGGEDGHLRIFEWPSLQVLLDEPKAHSSVKDLDFSLDSAFLASTSDAGPARVWDIIKAVPLVTLTRNQGESIGFCRFSRDGTKPFLFGTVTKGGKSSIAVWDMSTWRKLGGKKFSEKPISAFAVSRDGKFLAM